MIRGMQDLRESSVGRSPATAPELASVGIAALAMLGFAAYGFTTGAPSTVAYLFSVTAVGALVVWLRSSPLPGPLAIALAFDAVAHLAGGLVRVGHEVLYDASIGSRAKSLDTHILQYDHFADAFGSFVGTLTLWYLLAPPVPARSTRRLTVLCVLAGLGIGGLNEMIEFFATLADSGAHVGGYTNTGWDLVSNTVGALVAAAVITRVSRRAVTT